jgi:hypothetical protein
LDPREIEGIEVDKSRPIATTLAASGAPMADSTTSPRAALLEQLAAGITAAVASGDLEAARVAHQAIGKLLGSGGVPAVVDLDAERVKRGTR